ncbi:MAG TPA: carbon storage regulator CsrA [Ignavibacteriaceae bacterium]|jgi:carbon storage regulator|nr:carbon storage regulator CsrA [Ignavibacteriaceae bacterium]
MLVLTRKPGEKIHIGSDLTVSIISISENQVKIGIDAPPEVKIYRSELYEKLLESNLQAVDGAKSSDIKSLSALKNIKINKNADRE